jgi:hypothetical protein
MLNNRNKSGADWAKELSLVIENYRNGWNNDDEFNNLLLSRAEFLNRASISVIKKPNITSRRGAAQFMSNLNNKTKPAPK